MSSILFERFELKDQVDMFSAAILTNWVVGILLRARDFENFVAGLVLRRLLYEGNVIRASPTSTLRRKVCKEPNLVTTNSVNGKRWAFAWDLVKRIFQQ